MEVAILPKTKNAGNTTTPANKQKGKKICSYCKVEKRLTDFYISKNPLFAADERVPICKECISKASLNEDGSINELELNKILKIIDRPYYKDLIESSIKSFKKEHSYIDDEDVRYYGKEILQKYFTLIAMRQDRDKSYEESEREGFVHQTSNTAQSTKDKIARKYADIKNEKNGKPLDEDEQEIKEVKLSKKDKQNMKYVISVIGYDPFEDVGLNDVDKKYCYNTLASYCDTDGIVEDGHKIQGVIEMTMLYCQCKKINEAMNLELDKEDANEAKIQKLTTSKSTLLSSAATIAKDNNISAQYNKNTNQGKNSLTSKMKEMEENGYEKIKVNFFDIKTSEAFRQIDEISNNNIANQLTFDTNEYSEIVKEQRELIKKFERDIDELREENRNLKNKLLDLESKKR